MKDTLETINKYGVTAVMLGALLWLNSRLSTVEQRLYDCYNSRIMAAGQIAQIHKDYKKDPIERGQVYAILPERIRTKKERNA